MLHQEASRFGWLAGEADLDPVVTMDDATSEVYSAFLVEEDGTAKSFRRASALATIGRNMFDPELRQRARPTW